MLRGLMQLTVIVILYIIYQNGTIERVDEAETRAIRARLNNPDNDSDLLDADDVFAQLRGGG